MAENILFFKHRYSVIRERLLAEMLQRHVGNGMWQAMSEHEQHEKLLQLKLKEEKLRREGQLETMAIHLPGSRVAVEYNVFGLMGESVAELEKRINDEEEKVKESGKMLLCFIFERKTKKLINQTLIERNH